MLLPNAAATTTAIRANVDEEAGDGVPAHRSFSKVAHKHDHQDQEDDEEEEHDHGAAIDGGNEEEEDYVVVRRVSPAVQEELKRLRCMSLFLVNILCFSILWIACLVQPTVFLPLTLFLVLVFGYACRQGIHKMYDEKFLVLVTASSCPPTGTSAGGDLQTVDESQSHEDNNETESAAAVAGAAGVEMTEKQPRQGTATPFSSILAHAERPEKEIAVFPFSFDETPARIRAGSIDPSSTEGRGGGRRRKRRLLGSYDADDNQEDNDDEEEEYNCNSGSTKTAPVDGLYEIICTAVFFNKTIRCQGQVELKFTKTTTATTPAGTGARGNFTSCEGYEVAGRMYFNNNPQQQQLDASTSSSVNHSRITDGFFHPATGAFYFAVLETNMDGSIRCHGHFSGAGSGGSRPRGLYRGYLDTSQHVLHDGDFQASTGPNGRIVRMQLVKPLSSTQGPSQAQQPQTQTKARVAHSDAFLSTNGVEII